MSQPTNLPYTLHLGDCLETLRTLPDNSVDSVCTDPPYGLSFMGKKWDYDVPAVEVWAECLRVLKPGGHLLAFAGTRTQHRMACRIEDAGFEIRDMIAWVYGSGFPKSHNLTGEHEGKGTALKPSLEPITMARKPFRGTVAANVLAHGTGAINIDMCRVGWPDGKVPEIGTPGWGGPAKKLTAVPGQDGSTVERSAPSTLGRWPANLIHDGSPEVVAMFPAEAGAASRVRGTEASVASVGQITGHRDRVVGAFHGDSGSAARFFKQFEVTDDVWLANLSPALNVERNLSLQELAAAIAQSDAVTSALPEGIALSVSKAASTTVTPIESKLISTAVTQAMPRFVTVCLLGLLQDVHILSQSPVRLVARREQIGTMTITASLSLSDGSAESITFSIMPRSSAAGAKACAPSQADRLIYCAKTSRKDRHEGLTDPGLQFQQGTTLRKVENAATTGNNHPTVKPTDLMAYLCRLVTPAGGVVLDPFMGSGSTGKAAMREGFQFIGCELDQAYMAIARARIEHEHAKMADAAELAAFVPAQVDMFEAAQ